MEFVVTKQYRLHAVHGARNPAKNLIWSVPYHTRGHLAQRKHDILSSINISIIWSAAFAIASYFFVPVTLSEHWESFLTFWPISFAAVLLVNALSRWPFYKYSYEATKIFEAFGFEKPSMIDLPKSHDKADKEYYKSVGKPRPWQIMPWRYRYK